MTAAKVEKEGMMQLPKLPGPSDFRVVANLWAPIQITTPRTPGALRATAAIFYRPTTRLLIQVFC